MWQAHSNDQRYMGLMSLRHGFAEHRKITASKDASAEAERNRIAALAKAIAVAAQVSHGSTGAEGLAEMTPFRRRQCCCGADVCWAGLGLLRSSGRYCQDAAEG